MKKKNYQGFTLIETLIALGILSLIVVVATSLFISLLRGANKTKAIQAAKQNGNYSLSVMERMIRNSREVSECRTDYITIKSRDEKETTFRFCLGEDDSWIASVSGTLACDAAPESRLTSEEVKLASGSFTCPEIDGANPDVVGITFTLTQAKSDAPTAEQALVNFQTSVSLRNY